MSHPPRIGDRLKHVLMAKKKTGGQGIVLVLEAQSQPFLSSCLLASTSQSKSHGYSESEGTPRATARWGCRTCPSSATWPLHAPSALPRFSLRHLCCSHRRPLASPGHVMAFALCICACAILWAWNVVPGLAHLVNPFTSSLAPRIRRHFCLPFPLSTCGKGYLGPVSVPGSLVAVLFLSFSPPIPHLPPSFHTYRQRALMR